MSNLDHLNSLIAHGAQIICGKDRFGEPLKTPLDKRFYNEYVWFMENRPLIRALTFELCLPGIDEDLALTIWADGHIDSGSKESVDRCLDI